MPSCLKLWKAIFTKLSRYSSFFGLQQYYLQDHFVHLKDSIKYTSSYRSWSSQPLVHFVRQQCSVFKLTMLFKRLVIACWSVTLIQQTMRIGRIRNQTICCKMSVGGIIQFLIYKTVFVCFCEPKNKDWKDSITQDKNKFCEFSILWLPWPDWPG